MKKTCFKSTLSLMLFLTGTTFFQSSFAQVKIGGIAGTPEGTLHIDGSLQSGNTVTINDNEDAIIQLKKNNVVKGFVQLETDDMKVGINTSNTAGRLIFRTNAIDHIFLDNAGLTGIGNPSVGAKLYVDATATAAIALIVNDQNPTLQLQNSGVDIGVLQLNGNDLRLGTNFANSLGNVVFRTKGLDRARVDSNGDFVLGSGASILGSMSGRTGDLVFNSGSAAGRGFEFNVGVGSAEFSIDGTTGNAHVLKRLVISQVSNATPDALLHIDGNFDAASKTVIIDDETPTIQLRRNFGDKGFFLVDVLDNVTIGTNIANSQGDLIFRANNLDRFRMTNAGNIMIAADGANTAPPPGGNRLAVKGSIVATAFNVLALANWPDYVFDESYKLTTLDETETFINANKHLPGMPAATEIEKSGYEITDMQKRMMEKIEELTLHLIEANKEIKTLKTQMAEVRKK